MELDETMIVAGIGCRRGAALDDVLAAVTAALAAAAIATEALDLIATAAEKGGEPGIAAAASALGRPLVLVPADRLAMAGRDAVTHSERVIALFGVPSIAESAALAAAGAGARLLSPRRVAGGATCAIAASAEDEPSRMDRPSSPRTRGEAKATSLRRSGDAVPPLRLSPTRGESAGREAPSPAQRGRVGEGVPLERAAAERQSSPQTEAAALSSLLPLPDADDLAPCRKADYGKGEA